MRVIGAGLGRTGTFSLKLALEQLLDGPCYHMAEVFERPQDVSVWLQAAKGGAVDWKALLEGYAAGVDWPLCSFAVELAEVYPDALVLLSVRDFDAWWKSASSTIFAFQQDAEGEWKEMVEALFSNTFTLDLGNRQACREAFDRHHRRIRERIPASRILEWRPGDGWSPICDALGMAVPDQPFPHRNTTEEFLARRESGH